MSEKVTLLYIGPRNKAFTAIGLVTGERYYVEPGSEIEVYKADADAMLAAQPDLWARKQTSAEKTSKSKE